MVRKQNCKMKKEQEESPSLTEENAEQNKSDQSQNESSS